MPAPRVGPLPACLRRTRELSDLTHFMETETLYRKSNVLVTAYSRLEKNR